jgi:hypothetical protein
MAFVHGSTATFSLGGDDISAYVDSVSYSHALDTASTDAFANTDHTFIAGLLGGTLNIGGPWAAALDAIIRAAQTTTAVAFVYSPDAGTTTYTGSCFVSNYNPSSGVTDADRWTATLQITGAVT